ncbi:methylglyoxal synthase [Streptomyces sp. NPDC088785]|uniref:methylglyoxal synthase n=1 Tax=Streptomyces sp. NPDC088785 TaxID=3365897 RepID=UPI0037FA477D
MLVALVAHDNCKSLLTDWSIRHHETLTRHRLMATATTGGWLTSHLELPVDTVNSGPWGGDQQIGSTIAEGRLGALVFFWDPLASHPHHADVQALLRLATLHDVPTATNPATADLLVESLLTATAPGVLTPTPHRPPARRAPDA